MILYVLFGYSDEENAGNSRTTGPLGMQCFYGAPKGRGRPLHSSHPNTPGPLRDLSDERLVQNVGIPQPPPRGGTAHRRATHVTPSSPARSRPARSRSPCGVPRGRGGVGRGVSGGTGGRGARGGRREAKLCLDPDSCTGCSGCDFRPWRTDKDPDITVNQRNFCPANPVGPRLAPGRWTPLDLFKYFFSDDSVSTICRNTNANAAKNQQSGKKYKWVDITKEDLHHYLGLVIYMGLVKLDSISEYWARNTIFSVPFPATVMTRDRFRTIAWNLHMSDPEQDQEMDRKRGTAEHDPLFRLKPLMEELQVACSAAYQPTQTIAIDERMVATKAHTGMTQFQKMKPVKWGVKLFVMADSSNGYTSAFNIYCGKSRFHSGKGLGYDSVMALIDKAKLGTGYHLYVDNWYTSPQLFRDLLRKGIGACGTYRDDRVGVPKSIVNTLRAKDPRGTIRWIRDGELVFVKWQDTKEVRLCSTVHSAHSGIKCTRNCRDERGNWTRLTFQCPTPVAEYNRWMGGVDLSDQLIQYYSVSHKTMHWYRTLFFHFVDIATTNAYILHKELCGKTATPMTHRSFMQELCAQLCGVSVKMEPKPPTLTHIPVAINPDADPSRKATQGRKKCQHCKQARGDKSKSTPFKCAACDVPLCVIVDRNCFNDWHKRFA